LLKDNEKSRLRPTTVLLALNLAAYGHFTLYALGSRRMYLPIYAQMQMKELPPITDFFSRTSAPILAMFLMAIPEILIVVELACSRERIRFWAHVAGLLILLLLWNALSFALHAPFTKIQQTIAP
jgi:hypothetical protein